MTMSSVKVAVVTGANKGIGFAIVKGLCQKFDGKVYLTARDESLGLEAVNKLKKLGLSPHFHQLEIDDQSSIDKFRDFIETNDGGIDILINNASINERKDVDFFTHAEKIMEINYFGTLHVCETLFPIIRPNGRVVNITSSAGHLSRIPSQKIRTKLSSPTLTVEKINHLMLQYIVDVKENKHISTGWGTSSYAVSKVGATALSIIQQRDLDEDKTGRNILVNSVHPGNVITDMNSKALIPVEEGTVAPLYLALENHGLRGKFVWSDCKVVDWFAIAPYYIM